MGASDVVSYLVGSIAPVLGGIAIWIKARKFSGASAAIFSFTFLSAVIALVGSTTPKVLLYKDCAATALIGLVFLGSCVLAHKPVVFYMAQRYGTDGTHDGMSTFDSNVGRLPRLPQRDVRHQLSVGDVVPGPGGCDRARSFARPITPPPTTTTNSCPWSPSRWASSDRSPSAATSPRRARHAAPQPTLHPGSTPDRPTWASGPDGHPDQEVAPQTGPDRSQGHAAQRRVLMESAALAKRTCVCPDLCRDSLEQGGSPCELGRPTAPIREVAGAWPRPGPVADSVVGGAALWSSPAPSAR